MDFRIRVNARSSVNDWFSGTIVDSLGREGVRHTYASENNAGAPWVASWSSCCRISPHNAGNFHANNPDQSERLETLVDLSAPANSAPRSALPPINSCPLNAVCTLAIPHADAELDPVAFRLATSAEAGAAAYVPPGAPQAPNQATISAAGIITWDTTGATVSTDPAEHSLYSIQVVLEDGRTKTPLDFFIELVPEGVRPPRWVTPPTPCGETLVFPAGREGSFDIRAVSDDGRPVSLSSILMPAGASLPGVAPANPVGSTFTWTPTFDQGGTHLLVFGAEDDRGYAAPPCPVTVVVTLEPAANAGPDGCYAFGSDLVLDGSGSAYPPGSIVEYRWDLPHGPSPLYGPIVQRTLSLPEDLAPFDVTLTITTNDSKTATDTVRIVAYDDLDVTPTSSAERYTPFQRPRGTVQVASPCGGEMAGTPIELVVRYTTNDASLDAQLTSLLGPEALLWRTSGLADAGGSLAWELPFTVAERFALPLGLLNPTSQLLVLQGDYVLEASAARDLATGEGSSTFDVVLDHQFPLDMPAATVALRGKEDEA